MEVDAVKREEVVENKHEEVRAMANLATGALLDIFFLFPYILIRRVLTSLMKYSSIFVSM
jgi:hypothetical protein